MSLALLLWSNGANAHEFWLEPSAYEAQSDQPVVVRLCVGDEYQSKSLARASDRIEEFVLHNGATARTVVGRDGSDPAGFVRVAGPGTDVIVYRSDRAYTVQADADFVAYLREDGLEHVIPLRAQPDQPERPVRESYSRYARTLIRTDDGPLVDRPLGLELEVVAESESSFRVLYRGRPLAGALLKAMRLGGRDAESSVRTDEAGLGRFALAGRGIWRISVVHMVRPPAGVDAEWDSLWASLTFASLAAVPDPAPCANRKP